MKGATAVEYHQRCVRKLGEVCSRENQIVAELPILSESEPKDEKSWLDMSKEEVLISEYVATFSLNVAMFCPIKRQ